MSVAVRPALLFLSCRKINAALANEARERKTRGLENWSDLERERETFFASNIPRTRIANEWQVGCVKWHNISLWFRQQTAFRGVRHGPIRTLANESPFISPPPAVNEASSSDGFPMDFVSALPLRAGHKVKKHVYGLFQMKGDLIVYCLVFCFSLKIVRGRERERHTAKNDGSRS